jgi:hypothetical protein
MDGRSHWLFQRARRVVVRGDVHDSLLIVQRDEFLVCLRRSGAGRGSRLDAPVGYLGVLGRDDQPLVVLVHQQPVVEARAGRRSEREGDEIPAASRQRSRIGILRIAQVRPGPRQQAERTEVRVAGYRFGERAASIRKVESLFLISHGNPHGFSRPHEIESLDRDVDHPSQQLGKRACSVEADRATSRKFPKSITLEALPLQTCTPITRLQFEPCASLATENVT